VDKQSLQWKCVVSQPFDENTYITSISGRNDCLVVDPGFEPDKVEDALQSAKLVPAAILNTHGHSDHIAGNARLKTKWPDAPLVIGKGDAHKLTDPTQNLSANFGFPLVSPPADQTVQAGETWEAAGIKLLVRETPGHSAGHVIFLCKQHTPWVVFGGDVLFRGSIGRTDFPDGDHEALLTAIREELFTLPDDTIVLPGHGPPTTVGDEKATNPHLRMEN